MISKPTELKRSSNGRTVEMIRYAILFVTAMQLNSCGLSQESDVDSIEFAKIDTAQVTGTWRFTAAYAFSTGDESGLTAQISKGRNPTSDYLGLPECDLIVQSADSDYQALRLPGKNGRYFNPCAFVGAIVQVYPPNGQSTVRHQFPIGGYIEVFYQGNAFKGFKTSSEMGVMNLSINGAGGSGGSAYGIPSPSYARAAPSYGSAAPAGQIVEQTQVGGAEFQSVIPSEPEDLAAYANASSPADGFDALPVVQ